MSFILHCFRSRYSLSFLCRISKKLTLLSLINFVTRIDLHIRILSPVDRCLVKEPSKLTSISWVCPFLPDFT